ncbi:retinitis pigmentosa 1-like 1 protein isoform X2 [Pleurodeles waltl]|uniref:retinitis pigmentosa 1-like 1 protein isoform X2 n=1 Tax=Pleurodeles waltl TaxID=8319 RepID=UPI0037094E5A
MDLAPANEYLARGSRPSYEPPLPPVVRANAVTEVVPAKKITFFKSGDPQFSGVKMAINQRSFKSINTLMDDLSNRVPLPFGVRTITTPRGTHCINRLEQLEDGGCYLCSDKKYVQPVSAATPIHQMGPRRASRTLRARRSLLPENQLEEYSLTHSHPTPKLHKKITLVKNMDPTVRRLIILNRRNTRNFKTFLEDVSELLQYTVKKLYTLDGKRVDNIQTVLQSSNVLVGVGREAFKPLLTENRRKSSSDQLPGLSLRSHPSQASNSTDVSFGLKAKKSVIHPRSASSNRTRFSLSSEKSYGNGFNMSPIDSRHASFSKPKERDSSHSLVNDDIEKRVHVNKDGSLSVEMKVRFRLLNDETLQWSTQIKKSRAHNKQNGEELCVYEEEEDRMECREATNPGMLSETDESFYPCDADSYSSKHNEADDEELYCHNCGKQCQDYDIWKNPMISSCEGEACMRNAWQARSSGSSISSHRRMMCKQKTSIDSIRTTSSEEYTGHFVQESSCYSEVVENGDSRAGHCAVSHCRSQSGLSTATSSVGPTHSKVRVHGDRSRQGSSASITSKLVSNKSLDAQVSVELTHQKSDSDNNATSYEQVEPSSAHQSQKRKNITNHDRQDSNMSESSQSSQNNNRNICKHYGAHSKSHSSIHSLDKTGMETPRSANRLGSAERGCSDYNKHCRIKTERSSMSVHYYNDINKAGDGEEKGSSKSIITSVSARTLQSKAKQWSLERPTNAKDTDVQKNEGDKICPDEYSEVLQRPLCQNQKPPPESNQRLSPDSNKQVCENKTFSNSSSQHSEVEDVSKASSPNFNMGNWSPQSESSNSKQPGNKTNFSSGSNLFVSNLNGGEDNTDVSFGSLVSKLSHESFSSSSKYNCVSNPGVDRLESTSSGVSSNSEMKNEVVNGDSMSEDTLSKSSIANASDQRKEKKLSRGCDAKNCKRGSGSETACSTNSHCPSPPKGKPSGNKPRHSKLKLSSSSSIDLGSAQNAEDRRETLESSIPSTSASKPIISKEKPRSDQNTATTEKDDISIDQDVIRSRRKSSTSYFEKKGNLEVEDTSALIVEGSGMTPSALPNITSEEVVHEWLKNIPAETIVVEYEAEQQHIEKTATKTLKNSQITVSTEGILGEEAENKNSEFMKETLSFGTSATDADTVKTETVRTQENHSNVMLEGVKRNQDEASLTEFPTCRNSNGKDLPSTVHASVQIMKALLRPSTVPTIDRSHSLPEVSPTIGRKLSNSAKVLIKCLAGLKLLDEETEDPIGKSAGLCSSRYIDLVNIFQALWVDGSIDVDEQKLDRRTKEKPSVSRESHQNCSRDAEPTPASSSGVDVNSGSGGSGDGSVSGTGDNTVTSEKTGECKMFFLAPSVENMFTTQMEPVSTTFEALGDKEQCERPSSSSSMDSENEENQSVENRFRATSPNTEANKILQSTEQCRDCNIDANEVDEYMKTSNLKERNIDLDEGIIEKDIPSPLDEEETVDCEKEEPVSKAKSGDSTVDPVKPGSSDEKEFDPNALRSQGTTEANSQSDCDSTVYFISESNEKNESFVNKQSFVTDPVWVLKLLKKIEKEFITHYVDAMNEFKIRWNLEDNESLDGMIAELKSEVEKRIQKSVEIEVAKIQSRAGNKAPRPPNETSKKRPAQQVEQRRKRLQTMRKKSAFNELIMGQNKQAVSNDISLETDEEDLTFSASMADEISADDEYCPCETCIRKKLAMRPLKGNTVSASAPIVRAFDLREILRMKKEHNETNPACPCSSGKEVQESSVIQNELLDDTVVEPNPAFSVTLSSSGDNKNITQGSSKQENNDNSEQDGTSEHEIERACNLKEGGNNVCCSHLKNTKEDQDKQEEENTLMENHKAEGNNSEHESIYELIDNAEAVDEFNKGMDNPNTPDNITDEEVLEGSDYTGSRVVDYREEKENSTGEPGALGDGYSELSTIEERHEDEEIVESEETTHQIEKCDSESEYNSDADHNKRETAEPLDDDLLEDDSNKEKAILIETATVALECSSISDMHNPVDGRQDETDGVSADDMDRDNTHEIDDEPVQENEDGDAEDVIEDPAKDMETARNSSEEVNRHTVEDLSDTLAWDVDGVPKETEDSDLGEETDDDPAADETGAEEKDGCLAEEADDDPTGDTGGCLVQKVDQEPVEENNGPAKCVDAHLAEENNIGVVEETDDVPEEDIAESTPQEEHCDLAIETAADPLEDLDGGSTEEKYEDPAKEYNACPAKDKDEGPAEEDIGDEEEAICGRRIEHITEIGEEIDEIPLIQNNGGMPEDDNGDILEDIGESSTENMNRDTEEELDSRPADEMNIGPASNGLSEDLENGNGKGGHGDSDSSGSKPAQMYPDSSSDEEDRGSACVSPVSASNRPPSLKKANKPNDQSIELDDLDF